MATAEAKNGAAPEAEKPAAPAASGGIKSFLPLIISVALMPALAFGMTKFVLLPKLEKAMNPGAKTEAAGSKESAAPAGEGKEGEKGGEKGSGKSKFTVPMSKLLVNVSGTMGTRYLMTSLTLVGKNGDFKGKIEDNMDQLKDLASSALRSKTIADLEKPDAHNVIRSELISVFNNALGGPEVQEIYITELAIQ